MPLQIVIGAQGGVKAKAASWTDTPLRPISRPGTAGVVTPDIQSESTTAFSSCIWFPPRLVLLGPERAQLTQILIKGKSVHPLSRERTPHLMVTWRPYA